MSVSRRRKRWRSLAVVVFVAVAVVGYASATRGEADISSILDVDDYIFSSGVSHRGGLCVRWRRFDQSFVRLLSRQQTRSSSTRTAIAFTRALQGVRLGESV